MFVVVSGPIREEGSYMPFSLREAANAYAGYEVVLYDADIAKIYEVAGVEDLRKAIDAVKAGEGTLVDARVRRATPNQIRKAQRAEPKTRTQKRRGVVDGIIFDDPGGEAYF
ncbi:MAG: hypothetical protein WBQ45_17375 [Roseiarcus sp.]|jgi:hypothetical protein|uniref:hypothetical protein n=1 Tax=Roseiarcus sp. TaxID=1969460 RepID=UPI003BB223EF